MKAKLEERKTLLEKEFEELRKNRETLQGQINGLNQQLSQIQVRQIQLQGSYKEVTDLLGTSDADAEPKELKKLKSVN